MVRGISRLKMAAALFMTQIQHQQDFSHFRQVQQHNGPAVLTLDI